MARCRAHTRRNNINSKVIVIKLSLCFNKIDQIVKNEIIEDEQTTSSILVNPHEKRTPPVTSILVTPHEKRTPPVTSILVTPYEWTVKKVHKSTKKVWWPTKHAKPFSISRRVRSMHVNHNTRQRHKTAIIVIWFNESDRRSKREKFLELACNKTQKIITRSWRRKTF